MCRRARRHGAAALLVAALCVASPRSAPAVVGGRDSDGPLARSTVMVLSSRGGVCSGIVLTPEVVLTAAHCLKGASEHRVHFRGATGDPVLIAPAAQLAHPGYDAGAVAGRRRSIDLALLRLPEPLPARFSPATLSGAVPPKGAMVTLGGYGVLREGEAKSTGAFREAALAAVEPYGPGRVLLWLADPAGGGAGACLGDSGGPMAGPDFAIVAVTSWAKGGGRRACGEVSQGILLGPQRAWIDGVLGSWNARAAWR
jgi:hypothetical protein